MHSRGSVTIDLTTHLTALSCMILSSSIVTYFYFYLYLALYICASSCINMNIRRDIYIYISLSIPFTTFFLIIYLLLKVSSTKI